MSDFKAGRLVRHTGVLHYMQKGRVVRSRNGRALVEYADGTRVWLAARFLIAASDRRAIRAEREGLQKSALFRLAMGT